MKHGMTGNDSAAQLRLSFSYNTTEVPEL